MPNEKQEKIFRRHFSSLGEDLVVAFECEYRNEEQTVLGKQSGTMFVTPSYMAFYHEGRIRKDVQLVLTFASILKISKITTGLLNHKSILVETADAKYVFLGFRDFDTTLSTLQSNLQTAKLSDLASASDSSRNLVRAFPEHLQPVRSGSNASLSSSSSLPRLAASLSSGAVHADGSSSSLLSRTISPGESPAAASSSASSRSKRISVSTPVPSTSIRASTTALSSNPDEVIAIEAPVVLVGTPGTSDGASESTSEALSRPANAEEDSVTTVSTDLDSFEDEPDMNLEVFEPDSTLPMEFASIYDLSIAVIEARDLVYEDSKFDMVKKVGPSPPYCAIKIEDLHTHHKVLRHKEHAPKRTTCPVWNLPPSGYHFGVHLYSDRSYSVRFRVRYRTPSGLRTKRVGQVTLTLDEIAKHQAETGAEYDEWLVLLGEHRIPQGFVRVKINLTMHQASESPTQNVLELVAQSSITEAIPPMKADTKQNTAAFLEVYPEYQGLDAEVNLHQIVEPQMDTASERHFLTTLYTSVAHQPTLPHRRTLDQSPMGAEGNRRMSLRVAVTDNAVAGSLDHGSFESFKRRHYAELEEFSRRITEQLEQGGLRKTPDPPLPVYLAQHGINDEWASGFAQQIQHLQQDLQELPDPKAVYELLHRPAVASHSTPVLTPAAAAAATGGGGTDRSGGLESSAPKLSEASSLESSANGNSLHSSKALQKDEVTNISSALEHQLLKRNKTASPGHGVGTSEDNLSRTGSSASPSSASTLAPAGNGAGGSSLLTPTNMAIGAGIVALLAIIWFVVL